MTCRSYSFRMGSIPFSLKSFRMFSKCSSCSCGPSFCSCSAIKKFCFECPAIFIRQQSNFHSDLEDPPRGSSCSICSKLKPVNFCTFRTSPCSRSLRYTFNVLTRPAPIYVSLVDSNSPIANYIRVITISLCFPFNSMLLLLLRGTFSDIDLTRGLVFFVSRPNLGILLKNQ